MSEWRPIEAAPKDMRPILVFVPGTWELPYEIAIAFRKGGKGWVYQNDDHSYVEATHWMHLPEPPPKA